MDNSPSSEPFYHELQGQTSEASGTNLDAHNRSAPFAEGEVIRIELYEEVPKLNRETVVREKVQIKKISTQESADLQP
ncbi:MAG: DUF2382 domain-containing protein [Oscillatoriales cyanobacterium C42_A2020_001]|nr:DUF2382 domain-containing protein [Leptolyngbyaceae cyanobacterium C42_A2020_001]